jgi:hypothetical protein
MYMPSLSDELVSDLSLLSSLPTDDEVKEFSKMSTQIILQNQFQKSKHGTFISRKILEKAASKLGIDDPEKIDRCIGAIGYIFVESAKFRATPEQLSKHLHEAGVAFFDVVSNHFAENEPLFHEIVDKNRSDFLELPRYSKLDWRLDCVVSSRSKADQVTPIFTLKLDTKTGSTGSHESHLLQTDPANLIHMTEVLEKALAELKSNKVKKIQKFL